MQHMAEKCEVVEVVAEASDYPGPTLSRDRMPALDVVRGFALFGILLVNIQYFQRPLHAVFLGFDTSHTGIDFIVAWFVETFVAGKFYTMFSLLFGIGFVIFLDRAAEKTRWPRLLFLRRLFALALIGACHAFLVWSGDILLIYAAFGLLLLLFAGSSARKLLFWGAGLQVLLVLIVLLGGLGVSAALQNEEAQPRFMADYEQERLNLLANIERGDLIYSSGSWTEAVGWRIHELQELYLNPELLATVLSVLGMFLIGAAIGRSGVLRDPDVMRPFFRRMMWISYAIGLPCVLIYGSAVTALDPLYVDFRATLMFTLMIVLNISLCLAYISTLVVLVQKGKTWVLFLAPAGRMALSNYLMHSLVFTTLFYGYGLGLYGKFGYAAITMMALTLFGFQLWLSHWWLQRFRMGPMEWVWRTLTYGRVQDLRLPGSEM